MSLRSTKIDNCLTGIDKEIDNLLNELVEKDPFFNNCKNTNDMIDKLYNEIMAEDDSFTNNTPSCFDHNLYNIAFPDNQRNEPLQFTRPTGDKGITGPIGANRFTESTGDIRFNYALRVNLKAIDNLPKKIFERCHIDSWLNLRTKENLESDPTIRTDKLRQYPQISIENIRSLFNTFRANTDVQKNMYIACKKFADVIISREYDGVTPICLILSGDVGIGKTHLAVSVAKEITKKGRSALFLDAHSICRVFQKQLSFTSFLDELLKDIDLVILDSINERYGIEQETYKHIVDYVTEHDKALMITTNNILSLDLDHLMGYYPDFSDECAYDYVIMDKLSGVSYRQALSVTMTDITRNDMSSSFDIYTAMFNSSNNTLVFIDSKLNEFNRQEKLARLEQIYKNVYDNHNVFTTKKPAYCDRIGDMYMYELDNDTKRFDAVITCVYDRMGAEQFKHLLPIAHDRALRTIILIDDVKNFKRLIAKEFKGYIDRERYDNMLERYNVMFGPAFKFD